jgi:hypothetical protein
MEPTSPRHVIPRSWAGAALAVLGCGGGTPAAVANAGDVAAPAALSWHEEARGALAALAGALEADDGDAFDALIDPAVGLTPWWQPGALMAPAATLRPTGAAPSARLHEQMNPYYADAYWHELAAGVRHALARLDVEPVDPQAPRYQVDCATETGPARAWLRRGPIDVDGWPLFGEPRDGVDVTSVEVVLHDDAGTEVWLARAAGRPVVRAVLVWTPCDA